MQEYVQKSIITTLPRRRSGVSGGEFSQATAPSSDGRSPSIGPEDVEALFDIIAPPAMAPPVIAPPVIAGLAVGVASGWIVSINDCSIRLVLEVDSRVRMPVS